MSSTLYARGTMLQTGSRERAERVDQQLTELRAALNHALHEINVLRAENVEITRQIRHIQAVAGISALAPTTTT
jgi:hypothetical protein